MRLEERRSAAKLEDAERVINKLQTKVAQMEATTTTTALPTTYQPPQPGFNTTWSWSHLEQVRIARGRLLTTLPTIDKQFSISFDLNPSE